ncbi:OmpA family protein [Dermacoccaceae bacterium W4C1]
MSRSTRTALIVASLAGATALSACQGEEMVDRGPASATASASASATASASSGSASATVQGSATAAVRTVGDVGPDGSDAGRRENLSDGGGYVVQGTKITFVYKNGLRHQVDVGQSIPDGNSTLRTTRGVLVQKNGIATWTSRTGVTHVDAVGTGAIADRSGVIAVAPDGSVTCANSTGLQFVGADGSKASATTAGAFYVDPDGDKVTVGTQPAKTNLAGRYTSCNVDGTASIDLYSDVLFRFDSDQLTAAGKAAVASASKTISADAAGRTVQIVGHTDSKGSADYNQKLGQRRADAVAAELRRLDPSITVKVSSAGETQPVAANVTAAGKDNPAGRAENRRVTLRWAR